MWMKVRLCESQSDCLDVGQTEQPQVMLCELKLCCLNLGQTVGMQVRLSAYKSKRVAPVRMRSSIAQNRLCGYRSDCLNAGQTVWMQVRLCGPRINYVGAQVALGICNLYIPVVK